MTQLDYKYTDTDIRKYPMLIPVAIKYATDYCGEFDFLVAAKALAIETGSLPTAVARAVVNCMRSDPEAAPTLARVVANVAIVPLKQEAPKLTDVTHAYPYNLKLRVKHDSITSKHKMTQVYHLVNHTHSYLRYYPSLWKFQLVIKTLCGKSFSDVRHPSTMIGAKEGKRLCPTCNFITEHVAAGGRFER